MISEAQVLQAHLDTERYLKAIAAHDSSFSYTVVRIGIYSESFPIYTAFWDIQNPADEIRIPHDGSGPGIAWAKRDELGEAVSVLLKAYAADPKSFKYTNKTLILSGPKAWTLQETAEVFSRVLDRVRSPIKIKQVSVWDYATQEQVQEQLGHSGAFIWPTAFDAIRRGETSFVTPLLEELLGREPESFEITVAGISSNVDTTRISAQLI